MTVIIYWICINQSEEILSFNISDSPWSRTNNNSVSGKQLVVKHLSDGSV